MRIVELRRLGDRHNPVLDVSAHRTNDIGCRSVAGGGTPGCLKAPKT